LNIEVLRGSIKKNEGYGFVVKNKVAEIALKELGMEGALEALDGQVFLVRSAEEPQVISKELVNFAKSQEAFEIQGIFIDGNFQGKSYVMELSNMPSRHQLLASVVCGMKAPITNFVFILNALMKNLVVVLDQVSKKKSET